MADNASRRGATNLSVPLMILAFGVMAGFLYWLSVQVGNERAERAAAAMEAAAADSAADAAATVPGGGTVVAAEDLQRDATPFEGQTIRVDALPVAGLVGTQGFWIEMPNGNPFLVSLSSVDGVSVAAGQTATVTGVVHAVGDSVLTAWTGAGTISEGDRLAVEFATHFLEASGVEVGPGGASGN